MFRFVLVAEELRSDTDQAYDARYHQEVHKHVASIPFLFPMHRPSRSSPPCPDMLIYAVMRLFMPPIVEMWYFTSLLLLARTKSSSKVSIAFVWRLLLLSFSVRVVIRILCSLCAVLSIASRFVEARWWPTKCAALLVQPACWPRAK